MNADMSSGGQFLQEDTAHFLTSRGVIQLTGSAAVRALQPLVTSSLKTIEQKSVLTYMLSDSGSVFADLFVVQGRHSHRDDSLAEQIEHAVEEGDSVEEVEISLLVDCARAQLPHILERLVSECEKHDVIAADVSDRWRVFGELTDQATFKDGSIMIKYPDPRWHMGARILRPCSQPQSSKWGHELHWTAHALRLGVLPSAELIENLSVQPREANLHSIGVLDADCVSDELKQVMSTPVNEIARRLLPFRVEPNGPSFPTMTGLPIFGGGSDIGTVISHHGVYGLALVELASWRKTLQSGGSIHCADQTALITWPTWLASESRGRMGPAAVA